MSYLVQAALPGMDDAEWIKAVTREDAMRIAAVWLAEGTSSGIRIIARGRIYAATEFALIND